MSKSKIIGIAVVVLAVAYLAFSGFTGASTSYFYKISELQQNPQVAQGKFIRVEGDIVKNSAKWDADKIKLTFTVTDGKNNLPVVYNDIKPDNFDEAIAAIIEGRIGSNGVLQAEKLMLRCPSKYEKIQKEKQ